MTDIKLIEEGTQEMFDNLENICNDIVEENLYEHGRDWTQNEIDLFVHQFNQFQEEDPILDMNKLDPKALTLESFQKKFGGFDDNVIQMLYELENKKLEDSRIPPLRMKKENITLTDNLSNTIINEEDNEPKPKCNADC